MRSLASYKRTSRVFVVIIPRAHLLIISTQSTRVRARECIDYASQSHSTNKWRHDRITVDTSDGNNKIVLPRCSKCSDVVRGDTAHHRSGEPGGERETPYECNIFEFSTPTRLNHFAITLSSRSCVPVVHGPTV